MTSPAYGQVGASGGLTSETSEKHTSGSIFALSQTSFVQDEPY